MPTNKPKLIHVKVTERDIYTRTTTHSQADWQEELLELKDKLLAHSESTDLVDEALTFLTRSVPSDAFDVEDGSGDYGMDLIHNENGTITGKLWSNYDHNYDCSIQQIN